MYDVTARKGGGSASTRFITSRKRAIAVAEWYLEEGADSAEVVVRATGEVVFSIALIEPQITQVEGALFRAITADLADVNALGDRVISIQ